MHAVGVVLGQHDLGAGAATSHRKAHDITAIATAGDGDGLLVQHVGTEMHTLPTRAVGAAGRKTRVGRGVIGDGGETQAKQQWGGKETGKQRATCWHGVAPDGIVPRQYAVAAQIGTCIANRRPARVTVLRLARERGGRLAGSFPGVRLNA